MSLTPLNNIGEFALLERLAKLINIYNKDKVIKGIGDDAAVIKPDIDLA